MKPSVEDQLQGTCRVLENVVAPCVADPFARTILDGLIANLRMLTGALPAVAGFLRDDNIATVRLLETLRAALAPALNAQVGDAVRQVEPDVADSAALDARNGALRDLLAQAVRTEGLAPHLHRAIVKHFSERASRMPMRYVPTAPASVSSSTKP